MWSIILQPWLAEPIYHCIKPGDHELTRCGREIGVYKPCLPTKHVVKFARPCRGCFGAAA